MNRLSSQYEYMSLDDFEELLAAVDVHDRVEDGFFERPRLTLAQDILGPPAIDFELPLAEPIATGSPRLHDRD